jgi:XTP/dITP diphosphohydrolase
VEPVVARLVSHNEHKLRELRRVLPGWELELLEAGVELPPEVGESYYENARAKASFGRSVGELGLWMLGEDSGLEVEALGGAPGLRSARWAGGQHVERVLEALEGVEGDGRRARYVAELVALSPSGEEVRGTGLLDGAIADEPRGSAGFGFDPVFVPEGEEQTVAELGDDWKAEHSHRARAARALLGALDLR